MYVRVRLTHSQSLVMRSRWVCKQKKQKKKRERIFFSAMFFWRSNQFNDLENTWKKYGQPRTRVAFMRIVWTFIFNCAWTVCKHKCWSFVSAICVLFNSLGFKDNVFKLYHRHWTFRVFFRSSLSRLKFVIDLLSSSFSALHTNMLQTMISILLVKTRVEQMTSFIQL